MRATSCILAIGAFVMLGAAPTHGQEVSHFDVFAGYSFARVEGGTGEGRVNLNGWNVAATGNLTHWLGLTADVSGHYGSLSDGTDFRRHAYFVGPTVTWRSDDERLAPFLHVLFGQVRARRAASSPANLPTAHETSFGTVLGGGVDWAINDFVAIRPFQVEYLMTRFDEASGIVCIQTITTPCPTTKSGTQGGLRLSAGFTFRLGMW